MMVQLTYNDTVKILASLKFLIPDVAFVCTLCARFFYQSSGLHAPIQAPGAFNYVQFLHVTGQIKKSQSGTKCSGNGKHM